MALLSFLIASAFFDTSLSAKSAASGGSLGMALSALKGLALNANQGAGSIGPAVEAIGPQLELGSH